jgi:hypothetical protein
MREHPTWKSDLVWGAMAATVIGYEVFTLRANRLDHTLTRTVRRAFRTNHPYGKAAFAVGWGWFATWMMRHILEADDPLDAALNALKGNTDAP